MKYEVIDTKNEIIKVECSIEEYLSGIADKYIKIAIITKPKEIIVTIKK